MLTLLKLLLKRELDILEKESETGIHCKQFIAGISNLTIEKFIEEENDGSKKNFVGVFLPNSTTPFINILKMKKQKGGHYPFAILNIDRSNLPGTHWWSILNIHPKKQSFLFDSCGFTGFKAFIEQDDHDITNKILYDTKKFNKGDDIVTLIMLTFLLKKYKKLSKNEVLKLSPTAADLFHLIDKFAELKNVKK